MSYTWKYGDGFAIRYGGAEGIRWYFGDQFNNSNPSIALPPVHPAMIVNEILKTVALFLQWWELRKQTLLMGAQFEERRLPWIVDIMAQWFSELNQNEMRLDTVYFVDREISNFMKKLEENPKVDIPSTLLLQIHRSTEMLVSTNQMLSNIISQQNQQFTVDIPNVPNIYNYVPYFELKKDRIKLENYLEASLKVLSKNWPMILPPSPLIYLWGFKLYKDFEKELKESNDFASEVLGNFAIELRSNHAILQVMSALPPSVKVYQLEDLLNGRNGRLLSIEAPKT